MTRFSLVLPCYNEAQNLVVLVEKMATAFKRDDLEVIFVDNGSTDETSQILPQLLAPYPQFKRLTLESNRGYGHGVLSGLQAATGDVLGWTHADTQTDPQDFLKAIDLWRPNVFVKGRRQGRPLWDQFFTLGMSVFETMYLRCRLWDINAQPNLFSREFFESWKNPPSDFSLDLYVYYQALKKGLTIERFDVSFPERMHGVSSWNTGLKSKLRFIQRTIHFSRKLKRELENENHRS